MKSNINRRGFLKTSAAVGVGIGMAGLRGVHLSAAEKLTAGTPNAEKLGWRLGMQAWTFNQNTFFEAVDQTASLGLHYIEAIPGQRISDKLNGTMGPGLSADMRKDVLKKLGDSGVKLINIGVGGYGRADFEFAKDMGIETIVSEPEKENEFEAIDKLCQEFGINLAIHNHPKDSHYWNPDTVLKVCEGRSKRIGSCSDTGHWPRSGLKPIDCLKKLDGRIISFHLKDLDKFAHDGHDVPWGTGVCDIKGILAEVQRQKLTPVFSIEYEYNWGKALPEIAQCVTYFDKVAAELAAKG